MKNNLLIVSFLLINFYRSEAQDTIYAIAYSGPCPFGTAYCTYDLNDKDTANYFFIDSSQSNNIWQIGTPAKTIFHNAYSVPFALVTDTLNSYPNNNTSSFTFTVFSDDVTYIDFWHRINTDSLNDGGVVEYSTDGGLSWGNILNSPFTLTNFYPVSSTISSNSNLSGFTGTSGWANSTIQGVAFQYVRFRFTFTSDNLNTGKDGWMIDDITINCIGTGISEFKNQRTFHVSPNPASGFVNVLFENQIISFDKRISVTDVLGKEVFLIDVLNDERKIQINSADWNNGVYFITLQSGQLLTTEKIIINNN